MWQDMNVWQKIEQSSGMKNLAWIAIAFLIATLVLLYFRPSQRKRLRSALVFFALSIVGLIAANGTSYWGIAPNHWIYLSLRGASLFVFAAAIVNLTAVFLFAIVLRSIRLEPPHIAQDLV